MQKIMVFNCLTILNPAKIKQTIYRTSKTAVGVFFAGRNKHEMEVINQPSPNKFGLKPCETNLT